MYFNLLDEADLAELCEDDQDSASADTTMVREEGEGGGGCKYIQLLSMLF